MRQFVVCGDPRALVVGNEPRAFESESSANTKLEVISGGATIEATYRAIEEDSGGSLNIFAILGLLLLDSKKRL